MLARATIFISLLALIQCRESLLKRGLLAVIRDKVTPEEISEVILNPRKRDLTSFHSYQPQIETPKSDAIKDRKAKKSAELHRDLRAVQMITTRIKKSVEKKHAKKDKIESQARPKRIVSTQNNHKSKPLPAVFLTSIARVVVPASPESRPAGGGTEPEAVPRMLRLHEAKRAV